MSSYKFLVSVVIPLFKSERYIDTCLESVLKTSYPNFEILCLIDGNDRDLKKRIELGYKDRRIKIFLFRKRLWLGGIRAKGFKLARGKYVAFLDHDVEVDKNWLKNHVDMLESDASIVATQGKNLDINKKNIIGNVSIKFVPQLCWVICEGFGSNKNAKKFNNPSYSLAGATNVVFRKSIVKKIGYHDEKFKFNIDDLDLAIRLWVGGMKTLSCPKAVVYHWTVKKSTQRDEMIKSFDWEKEFQKTIRIVLKNYELSSLIRYLPLVLSALFFRSIWHILKGNLNPFVGFLYSLGWNIKYLPDTLKERKRIQSNRKFSDIEWMSKVDLNKSFLKTIFKDILSTRKMISVFQR